MKSTSIIFLLSFTVASGLDIVFDSIECDTSLPAYARQNGIMMTCNGNTRCTLGDSATISGEMVYDGLVENIYDDIYNGTSAFTSATLQLMTLEYQLFEFLPFNFCGDWILGAENNQDTCPDDGIYQFEVPYQLPKANGLSAWFATGWAGVSYVKIYEASTTQSTILANCKLHFTTLVTDSGQEDWYTLPSAAQVTIVLFGVLGALFALIVCLACCRSKNKLPTDHDYPTDYKSMSEDEVMESRDAEAAEDVEEKARRIAVNMRYNGTR